MSPDSNAWSRAGAYGLGGRRGEVPSSRWLVGQPVTSERAASASRRRVRVGLEEDESPSATSTAAAKGSSLAMELPWGWKVQWRYGWAWGCLVTGPGWAQPGLFLTLGCLQPTKQIDHVDFPCSTQIFAILKVMFALS